MAPERILTVYLQAAHFSFGAPMLLEESYYVFTWPEQRQDAVFHTTLDVCGKTHVFAHYL